MYLQAKKQGQWETVKTKADDKKKRDEKKAKAQEKDRLGVTVPTNTALAAFDRNHAAKEAAKEAAKNAFADLEVEAPPRQVHADELDSDDTEPAASSNTAAAQKKPKAPKAPKKPKLSVAQVAAGEWRVAGSCRCSPAVRAGSGAVLGGGGWLSRLAAASHGCCHVHVLARL